MPQNFVWFWTLPAAVAVFLLSSLRKRGILSKLGDLELIQKLTGSYDPLMRWLKRALITGALACIVFALCQPHLKTKEIEVERRGVDVIIAIDVSKSMLAKDIAPNRLEKAKLEFSSLVDKLKGDRIGIIAFAGEAFISCPLTLDRNAVKLFLGTVNPNLVPTPGTAIGSAINVAVQAFGKAGEEKALILLTDGEDHASKPEDAARRAKGAGIRIFTIGVGTAEGSTLPGGDFESAIKRDRSGNVVLSKLDERLLKAIAQTTGGAYFRSTRGELEIDALVAEIRKMTQKGFRKDKIIEYEENYQYFLWIALVLLFLEQLLSERRFFAGRGSKMASVALLAAWLPFATGFGFLSAFKNEEGNKYYKKGQLGKAKAAYSDALKADPKSPEIAFNLGNAYYKEGSFERSLASYAKAVKSQKDTAFQSKAFYNLGNTWVRRKDPERAIAFYKDALRLDPKDEDAKYNLELLLKQQNKDQNKQQDKKDQQDQQNQQDKKDQQGQGGGGQGQQDQKQDQKDQQSGGEGGQGQQDKKEQGQDQQQKGQEQKDQDQDGKDPSQDQKEQGGQQEDKGGDHPKDKGDEPQDKPGDDQKDGRGGSGDEKQDEQPKDGDGQGGEGPEENGDRPEPKTQAEIRAEQILAALEGQEKQIMRSESGKNPGRGARPMVDKDW